MTPLTPPPLIYKSRCWSSEELAATAAAWAEALAERLAPARTVALVMANHPESVALLFALSSLPSTVVLLPPDLAPWHTRPPLPKDTRVILAPGQRALEAEARALGLEVIVAPDAAERPSPAPPRFFAMPGLVLFTSGSTGGARPVFRRTAGVLATSRSLVATLGLAPGDGVVTSLPIARAFGLHHGLIAPSLVGGPLGLLDRFDHRALLRHFASGRFRYWPGMPTMADALARCALSEPPVAPEICLVGARVSPELAARFHERFGVPLRQGYGTTETGGIAVDASPPAEVRSHTVGQAMRGVELRVGATPHAPAPTGAVERIWVRAPASMMEGYGFPPELEPAETVDGWWSTPDVGSLDAEGYLHIAGRVDDTFRTAAGHLVSPAAVAAALDRVPGVQDAAVVPLPSPGGPVLGVLIESAAPIGAAEVRLHLADALPAWSQPRVVQWTERLPRLAAGKVDRQACIAVLERALAAEANA